MPHSSSSRRLRIAILTHSTNPRGGVVHSLELGDALARLGHEVTVHAPDVTGRGFFRDTLFRAASVPALPAPASVTAMVEQRMAEYIAYFEPADRREFDVFHAQDGISGNALASLKAQGLIPGFVRTVHHIDDFADERLLKLQRHAIVEADKHLVVSRLWQDRLLDSFGLKAEIVGNGVDRSRFTPQLDGREIAFRERYGVGRGPVFLAIGGVEIRKNTIGILNAFAQVRAICPGAQLIIAGGASVLDHSRYQGAFESALAAHRLPQNAVIRTGTMADGDMPALYRLADTLVTPSVKEGFGLVVIEAMACGIPVVTSRIAPFTEYLEEDDVLWCNPQDCRSIADAMLASLNTRLRPQLIAQGRLVAARHEWSSVAAAHLSAYESLLEPEHA